MFANENLNTFLKIFLILFAAVDELLQISCPASLKEQCNVLKKIETSGAQI